nr:hypothetical protein [Xylella fastidiosa]
MNRLYIQDSGQTYRNTTYQAYTKPTHQLGELVTAGIEKLLEITKIASPASRLQAAAAKELMYNTEQGNYSNLVYLEGHSRGTMTLSNALRVLAGFNVGDTKLEVLAYNPAAEGNRLNTTYQAYTKPTHQLGELVTAGIEKLLEITKIASPASRLKAAAAKELMYNASRDNYSNPVYLEGHSRGTMKLSNALRVLAADHVFSDDLKILAFNPAAEGNRLAEAAALVTKKPVKTWARPRTLWLTRLAAMPAMPPSMICGRSSKPTTPCTAAAAPPPWAATQTMSIKRNCSATKAWISRT